MEDDIVLTSDGRSNETFYSPAIMDDEMVLTAHSNWDIQGQSFDGMERKADIITFIIVREAVNRLGGLPAGLQV